MSTEVRASSVISAVHTLGSRNVEAPTAAEIAKYVRAEEEDVLVILRSLKRRGIFDDRRRAGARRWFPWEKVN